MFLKLLFVALALLFVGSIADVPVMFLAVRGMLPLSFVFIVGFLADVIPDFFWYWLGGKIGIERFERLPFLKQKPERMEAVGTALDKYGGLILFGSKFVYAFGIPTQVVAGAHHYSLKKMMAANALGAAGWLALLYYLAKIFNSVDVVEQHLENAKIAFLAFFVIALVFHFVLGAPLKRLLKSKKSE